MADLMDLERHDGSISTHHSSENNTKKPSENQKKYSRTAVGESGRRRKHVHNHQSNVTHLHTSHSHDKTHNENSSGSSKRRSHKKSNVFLRVYFEFMDIVMKKNKTRRAQKIEDFAIGIFSVVTISVILILVLNTFGNDAVAVDFYSVLVLMSLMVCITVGIFYKNNHRRRFVGYGLLWSASIILIVFLCWLYYEINIVNPTKDAFEETFFRFFNIL